ncbi:outer membrane lipoprotein-sorting protein [Candidatus Haliotispira prima]|uniref:Outer membrane lipoprotein-sorting protein n=1 Tax=Candidatus Haliotispira prima TaxID=3034016 RepID=A0ABY8MGX2_9SPIO|nr:outer membrane lipoprotein-sorting protein [Candidatus Haliotispira prima]
MSKMHDVTNKVRSMIPAGCILALLFSGLFFGAGALFSQDSLADRVLATLRSASKEKQQFRTQAKLFSGNAEGEETSTELLLYVDRNDGTQKSLAKVLTPERNKGNIFLNNAASYWVYYPKLQRSLALSPLSTLAGDVSIGDLLAPPPMQIYSVKVLESDDENVTLELTKAGRTAPYSRVVQHYKGEILKTAEFYGGQKGGILMKRVQYLKPIRQNNRYFYTQVKILNELRKGSYSVMAFSPPENIKVPSGWFNPNNLQQVP